MTEKLYNNLPLSFRLSPAARYHRLPNGKSVLVLGFPLRTAFVHADSRPLLSRMADGRWVPFNGICAAAPLLSIEEIQRFLTTLIRKGYVEQRGYPLLKESNYPSVSVIVPVRNRPDEIKAYLESLTSLAYPPEKLEIIVVDDASTDDTARVVEAFPEVRLLRMRRHRQASYCRNRAADISNGEILAFIDSDCLAGPTWLKELVPAFLDTSLCALGGWIDAASEKKKYAGLRKRQIPVARIQVVAAVLRSYLSIVYHCSSFISRNYLVGLPLVLLISPLMAGTISLMHLIAGTVEYRVKKPHLNLLSFLFFFTSEQVSYQSGVWWQCIRQLNFKPVFPRVVHKQI